MRNTHLQNPETLLRFEKVAPNVYRALQELKRTGWVERGVVHPESVKEHTEALLVLAEELSPLLTVEETDKLSMMLEVHDWPEAIHGDEVILEMRSGERKVLKAAKFENEKRAMDTICNSLPNGTEILELWMRFEMSDDPAAAFARELDKYQAVEKSLFYEQTQGIILFEEFLQYSINFIHHPILIQRINNLKKEHEIKKPL